MFATGAFEDMISAWYFTTPVAQSTINIRSLFAHSLTICQALQIERFMLSLIGIMLHWDGIQYPCSCILIPTESALHHITHYT